MPCFSHHDTIVRSASTARLWLSLSHSGSVDARPRRASARSASDAKASRLMKLVRRIMSRSSFTPLPAKMIWQLTVNVADVDVPSTRPWMMRASAAMASADPSSVPLTLSYILAAGCSRNEENNIFRCSSSSSSGQFSTSGSAPMPVIVRMRAAHEPPLFCSGLDTKTIGDRSGLAGWITVIRAVPSIFAPSAAVTGLKPPR